MKEDLRKTYLLIRKKIDNRIEKDNIIFQKVINNEKIIKADTILIYVAKEEEVTTKKLIEYFLKNKNVAVPKIENNTMNFYYINNSNDLEKGYFGILEPITKEKVTDFNNAVCVTPGICFSYQGYRIGYGKGFYDKFFAKHNIYSIGLCYQECVTKINFQEKYDYKVNEIITD